MCFNVNESQCLMYFVFVFSKPQPCNCTRVEQHYQPRPFTKTDQDHHLYASCCHEVRTPLYAASLNATYCHPLSHRLIKKYILWSRSFCSLCQRVYKIVCCIAFRRRIREVGSQGPLESPTLLNQRISETFFVNFWTVCLSIVSFFSFS